MGSFKLRLVAYFILLSLLPLIAVSWAFSNLAAKSEVERADSRLGVALRVAAAEYESEVAGLGRTADSLARAMAVERNLEPRNRAALIRLAQGLPTTAVYVDGRLLSGTPPKGAVVARSAPIRGAGARGEVVVWLSIDGELLQHLRAGSGLAADEQLVLARGGRVFAGPDGIVGTIAPPLERPRELRIDGAAYRALGTPFPGRLGATLVALTPRSAVDAAVRGQQRRLLTYAIVALAVAAALAYVLGRTIVRSLRDLGDAAAEVARGRFGRRVRVRGHDEVASLSRAFNHMAAQLETRDRELDSERMRVSNAIARFGDALAATHDPFTLLPVIVESSVEATGAVGGRLLFDGSEIVSGDPLAGGRPLEIPLDDEQESGAVLQLMPRGEDFTDEARERAYWLGRQASVALENARLHRQLARQAVTDGLTELPNRRQFEESLEGEIGRVERFGGSLGLIFADLDDFKQVNDRFGHQAGDVVLCAFASVLREVLREIDLPTRYGGDEFAVLLPQTDLAGTEQLAERLRRALAARPVQLPSRELLALTASFGAAAYPDAPTQAGLLAAADEALYRAKAQGKGCVAVAGDETAAPPAA